jgi:hypothetical protein
MNTAHLPVVRYRTAKSRDRVLPSWGGGDAHTTHRTVLTLRPPVPGYDVSNRVATRASSAGDVARRQATADVSRQHL